MPDSSFEQVGRAWPLLWNCHILVALGIVGHPECPDDASRVAVPKHVRARGIGRHEIVVPVGKEDGYDGRGWRRSRLLGFSTKVIP